MYTEEKGANKHGRFVGRRNRSREDKHVRLIAELRDAKTEVAENGEYDSSSIREEIAKVDGIYDLIEDICYRRE